MQLFSADTTLFNFFAPKNMKQLTSKELLIIGPNFFVSIANRPKTSPNLNFCFIKIAHHVTYVL